MRCAQASTSARKASGVMDGAAAPSGYRPPRYGNLTSVSRGTVPRGGEDLINEARQVVEAQAAERLVTGAAYVTGVGLGEPPLGVALEDGLQVSRRLGGGRFVHAVTGEEPEDGEGFRPC